MQRKSLLAAALAVAFAFPLAATAGGNKDKATSANGGNDGGAAAMFKSMDKNGDGFITKDEAKGTPHDADFASLDKNGDGKLSADEHYNAKEHVAARKGSPAASATPSASTASSSDQSAPKKTY